MHDNNVTAAPIEHFRKFCADATAGGVRLDFHQGLDTRLLTDEHAAIIARSKFARRIHLAFDQTRDEEAVREAVATMVRAGIATSSLTFLVLVGFDSTPEDDIEGGANHRLGLRPIRDEVQPQRSLQRSLRPLGEQQGCVQSDDVG